MELLNLAIVASIVSVLIQLTKKYVPDGLPRAGLAIVLALIAGGIAFGLGFLPELKEALIGVLALSNIAYGVIVKHLIPQE